MPTTQEQYMMHENECKEKQRRKYTINTMIVEVYKMYVVFIVAIGWATVTMMPDGLSYVIAPAGIYSGEEKARGENLFSLLVLYPTITIIHQGELMKSS